MIEFIPWLIILFILDALVFIIFLSTIWEKYIREYTKRPPRKLSLDCCKKGSSLSLIVLIMTFVILQIIANNTLIPTQTLQQGYERINNINHLNSGNSTTTYRVALFNPKKYEIGKPNFGSSGCCYGIVKMEREAYLNKHPRKMTIAINPETGIDDDDSVLYPSPNPYFFRKHLNEMGTSKNLSWEELTQKRPEGIAVDKLRDKLLVKEIIDLHQKQEFTGAALFNWPQNDGALTYFMFTCIKSFTWKCPIGREIDTNWIISQIKQNRPVIIAVGNTSPIGHAMLCYKIDIYNNSDMKLYLLDPNYVYAEPRAHFEEQTYMLIWKENGKQHFSYNPQINRNNKYQGKFNSFTPGAHVCWD